MDVHRPPLVMAANKTQPLCNHPAPAMCTTNRKQDLFLLQSDTLLRYLIKGLAKGGLKGKAHYCMI